MMTPLDMTVVRQSLANFNIPPRPDMLVQLQQEMESAEPDLKRIAAIIHQDVGIAGFTLKVVNSAYFNLPRKITSIDHACMFLGLPRVVKLVNSVALKFTLSEGRNDLFTERLWRTSADVGAAAMTLGKVLGWDEEAADELYTAGLFHNAGKALILEQQPDYPELLHKAYSQSSLSISEYESKHIRATHELLGFLLAQVWGLTQQLSNVIAYHHSPILVFVGGSEHEKQLMALLKLAEHMTALPQKLADAELDHEWNTFSERILTLLELKPNRLQALGDALKQSGIDNIYGC